MSCGFTVAHLFFLKKSTEVPDDICSNWEMHTLQIYRLCWSLSGRLFLRRSKLSRH